MKITVDIIRIAYYNIYIVKAEEARMKSFTTAVYTDNGVTKTKTYFGQHMFAQADASARAFNGYYTLNRACNGLIESEIKSDYRK